MTLASCHLTDPKTVSSPKGVTGGERVFVVSLMCMFDGLEGALQFSSDLVMWRKQGWLTGSRLAHTKGGQRRNIATLK